jgi:hypothetical protein
MTVSSIESLHTHLQWAIQVESTTIPPYLCALYSIKDGHNQEATEILRSIFLEEMLHMTLCGKYPQCSRRQPAIGYAGFHCHLSCLSSS